MRVSPLTELHAKAGAHVGPRGDVLTFGDVPGEYRAARTSACVFDQTARGLLGASGPDAAAFLHRLLANDVRNLAPGQGNRNLLLTPKGKVRFELDLERDEERLLLSTEPGAAPELRAALDTYLFSEKVELADLSETHAPLDLCGPRAREVLAELLGSTPAGDRAHAVLRLGDAPVRVSALAVAGSAGWRADAGAAAAELWTALLERGVRPAGLIARDSLRVEAGAALSGADVDEGVYPQEARLEAAFSLDKGCYIGQEVVAKIDTYGGLNKRLVALRLESDEPLARGARLYREEEGEWRDLGLVTSWAYSFELDTGLALGYVKRRHQDPGTVFRIGAGPARGTIVALPVRGDALPLAP